MKTLQIALTMITLFAALPALADWNRPGPGRPGHGGGGRWRCERATDELNQAQANFNQAQAMVFNNAQLCPGGWQSNAACMMAIANNYNQAKANLDRAQQEYYRACR